MCARAARRRRLGVGGAPFQIPKRGRTTPCAPYRDAVGRSRTSYVCSNCGHSDAHWFGRCRRCGEYNTAEETIVAPAAATAGGGTVPAATFSDLVEVDPQAHARMPSGIAELDRVLGGGIVPGSYIILGAEPGAGKSTLSSQLLIALARAGRRVALVAAEESPGQVKLRFARLGSDGEDISISAETEIEAVISALEARGPDLVVVDSIQTVQHGESGGTPGSVGQVRECGQRLMRLAKEHGISVLLIGQVTKEGTLAGPRTLEHLVDVVLGLEGEREQPFRVLRAFKNRFGSTDEVGLFAMTGEGLVGVADPSTAFSATREEPAAGAIACPVIEGSRPIIVEVQALVNPSNLAQPIRAARGIDGRRLQLLLAVLSRRCGLRMGSMDVFVQVAGGLSVSEPALDAAVCMAVASAYYDRPPPEGAVACGEVTLLGEIRPAPQRERRVAESERLGHPRYIGAPACSTLAGALEQLGAPSEGPVARDGQADVADIAA